MRATRYIFLSLIGALLSIPPGIGAGFPSSATHGEDVIILRGTIKSVENSEKDEGGLFLRIRLDLALANTRKKPLIFLSAERPEYYWNGDDPAAGHPFLFGALMFKQPEFSARQDALADSYYGPSDYGDAPEWKALRASLDQLRPPTDKVRILMPNEEWHFEDVLRFSIHLRDSRMCAGGLVCPPAGWETIQPLKVVWLRPLLEIWPTNLEPHPLTGKVSFGHRLQKRWLKYGVLQLDTVVSEPIKFDLSGMNPVQIH